MILMCFLMLLLSGCMIAGNKTVNFSGTKIDKKDLFKIKIGQTTRSELIALFGAPTSKWLSPDKSIEKLTYCHKKTVTNQSVLIFIWAFNDTDHETNTVAFTLKDGIVESYRKE